MSETELTPGESAVDISPLQDGGVIKEISTPGEPGQTPVAGDVVQVHYVGKLTDGSLFDSSRDRGEKFTFNLGKGEVIKGWDIGVASMTVGERATFYIKSEYGYGPTGSPPKIPGGATLVFDVELFSFSGEDITKEKDGGVVKRVKTKGEGFESPNDGARVEIELKGLLEGSVFDERSLEFEMGEGLVLDLPPGLELGLQKMKMKEVAELTLLPAYGFKSEGCKEKGVGPNATLKYEVTLKNFEKCQEAWQLDPEKKVDQAKIFKEKGTKFFKDGKFEIASSRYSKVIDLLEHEISLKGELEVERKSILQAGRLNLALCHMKLKDWIEARNICTRILEENAEVEKAWFRRGEANFLLNDWENAKHDFEKAVKLDPENKAAVNKVLQCEKMIKLHQQKEKKTFANMFDRFAAIDQKREEAEKIKKPDTMNNIDEWNSGKEGAPVVTDPNSISVGGDISMNMDINQAIEEDQKIQEEVNGH